MQLTTHSSGTNGLNISESCCQGIAAGVFQWTKGCDLKINVIK